MRRFSAHAPSHFSGSFSFFKITPGAEDRAGLLDLVQKISTDAAIILATADNACATTNA